MARLKKLEEKSSSTQGMWATFTMTKYEDPIERAKVKQRLLDEYIAQGNSMPMGCIYWNEICPELGNRDAFTGSYPTNPLEEIMNKIAQNPCERLDGNE